LAHLRALDPNRRGVRYTTCLPSTTVVGIAGRDGHPTAKDLYIRPRERHAAQDLGHRAGVLLAYERVGERQCALIV
jgi:hypothetical protein